MCDIQKLNNIYRRLSYLGSDEQDHLSDSPQQESQDGMRLYNEIIERLRTEFNLVKIPSDNGCYSMETTLAEQTGTNFFEPKQSIKLEFEYSSNIENPCILVNMHEKRGNQCIQQIMGANYKTALGDFDFISDIIKQFIVKWKERYAYAISFLAKAERQGLKIIEIKNDKLVFILERHGKKIHIQLEFTTEFQPANCANALVIHEENPSDQQRYQNITAINLLKKVTAGTGR